MSSAAIAYVIASGLGRCSYTYKDIVGMSLRTSVMVVLTDDANCSALIGIRGRFLESVPKGLSHRLLLPLQPCECALQIRENCID